MCFGIVYGDGRSVGTATSRLVGGLSGIGIRLADEAGVLRRRLASVNRMVAKIGFRWSG
jgi:hypothetical protein